MSIIKNYRARKEAKRKRRVREATKAYDTYRRKKDEDAYKAMGRQRREQAAYQRLGSDKVIAGRLGGGLAGGIVAGASLPFLFYSKGGRKIISKLPDKGRLGKYKEKMLRRTGEREFMKDYLKGLGKYDKTISDRMDTVLLDRRNRKMLTGAYLGGLGGVLGGAVSSVRELGRREKYATNKKDKLIFRQNAAIKKYMKNRSSFGDDPYTIPNDIKLVMERDPAFIRTVMKQYDKKR